MSGSRSKGLHLSHYRTYCYCSYVTRVRHQVSRHEKLMSGKEKQYMTTSHDEESALTRKSTRREGKEEMMERGNHGTPCVIVARVEVPSGGRNGILQVLRIRSKLTGWLWESGTLKMRGRGKKDAVLRLHVPCTKMIKGRRKSRRMSAALLACIYSASILHMLQTLLLFHLFSSFFICVRYFMHEA